MMSTRRSLLVMGALLPALMLFSAGGALAQTGTTDTTKATAPLTEAPTGVGAFAFADKFDELEVRWTEPVLGANDADQGPITGYRVYYSTVTFAATAAGTVTTFKDFPVDATTKGLKAATIGSLESGKAYFVRVAGKNGYTQGIGTASAEEATATVTGADPPDRVTDVKVTAGDKMLSVSWTAPYAGHASLMISKYVVSYQTSETATKSAGTSHTLEVTSTSATISNLTNGVMYDVQVEAQNDAKKKGLKSTKVTGTPTDGTTTTDDTTDDTTTTTDGDTAAAGTPAKVTLDPVTKADIKATSVMVSWMAPGSGDAPLLGYQVEYKKMGATTAMLMETTTTTATITGLTAATMYQVRVAGRNRIGVGTWSDYTDVTTAAAAGATTTTGAGPVKMSEPMVEPGDKMLMVSWTEPASERSITHYLLDYKTASATTWMTKPMNVTAMDYTIKSLINDTAYLVRVRAVDSAGAMSPWSNNGGGTPKGGMPTPTPALPLFGAFGLGAGLLAVGRARMRRRQAQFLGRREQRQMTR